MLKVAIIDYGGHGVFINENIHTNQPIYLSSRYVLSISSVDRLGLLCV